MQICVSVCPAGGGAKERSGSFSHVSVSAGERFPRFFSFLLLLPPSFLFSVSGAGGGFEACLRRAGCPSGEPGFSSPERRPPVVPPTSPFPGGTLPDVSSRPSAWRASDRQASRPAFAYDRANPATDRKPGEAFPRPPALGRPPEACPRPRGGPRRGEGSPWHGGGPWRRLLEELPPEERGEPEEGSESGEIRSGILSGGMGSPMREKTKRKVSREKKSVPPAAKSRKEKSLGGVPAPRRRAAFLSWSSPALPAFARAARLCLSHRARICLTERGSVTQLANISGSFHSFKTVFGIILPSQKIHLGAHPRRASQIVHSIFI